MATEWDSEQSNDVVYTFVPFHSFFFCFLRIANFFVGTHPIPLWMGAKREHENGWKSQRAHFFFLLDSLLGACAELGTVNVYVKCALGFFLFLCTFSCYFGHVALNVFISHTPPISHPRRLFFHFTFLFLYFGGAVERRTTEHHVLAAIIRNVFSCVVVCSRSLLIFPNNRRPVQCSFRMLCA